MSQSAEVHSLDVLSELRVALIRFAEDATIGLQDVEFEIRRTLEWLSNEQRLYWQSEIRRWQQKLSQAKTELARKKLMKFGDHRPDTSQEEKAVRAAAARLENAERSLQKVKSWVPQLRHAVQEYRSQVQPLSDGIELQIPRHVARLDRMIEALEAYARLSAPRASEVAGKSATTTGSPRESFARSDTDADADADADADSSTQEPGFAESTRNPEEPAAGESDAREFGLE